MPDVEQAIWDDLKAMLPEGMPLELPPPIAVEMGFRFTAYEPGKSLTCCCPTDHKFTNPMGVIQGGVLGVALDIAYGSLAYLIAKVPCVSTSMQLDFVRPLPGDHGDYTVHVELREMNRKILYLDGRVVNQENEVVAISTTTMKALG